VDPSALRARAELAPLRRWERISDRSYRTYVNGANATRIRRVLDFIQDGDRVLDVGVGFGYVTGMLLRERRLQHYCGIDLKQPFLDAVADMARANALDLRPHRLEVKDVHDIDPAWMAELRPDVVLMLEVLEHVADPAAALRALSATVEPSATVLFTVPLLGRLDGVWGHLSRFDRARIEAVCDAARLTIHHVEPVLGTWVLVAASTGARDERIVAAAAGAPRLNRRERRLAEALPRPSTGGYSVVGVLIDHKQEFARPGDDQAHVELDPRRIGVTCRVHAGPDAPAEGGVRLRVRDPGLIRLELTCFDPAAVTEIAVAGLDANGAPRLRWTWGGGRRPIDGTRRTHVLRPDASGERFRVTRGGDPHDVVALDVVLHVRPGASAGMRLHRAAYASPWP
jgi:2-polyprenyl-3-methyl-5-hydroxy-6-metoxy-1,4-benzoquinol methylase